MAGTTVVQVYHKEFPYGSAVEISVSYRVADHRDSVSVIASAQSFLDEGKLFLSGQPRKQYSSEVSD